MSSWYIVLNDHTLERFNSLSKEPIKRGDLLLCKTAKKGKLSTKRGYTNYEFSEDIVFKLTNDDFLWLLPIPFASTRYEMLTEKRKVWSQREKIKRGTLLRVYIQKLEQVFYARVREIVEPENKRGKMIQVKLDLHGDDNIYHITVDEVLEICEEHESSRSDKRFRINDRVVSSFNWKHGYIEAFVDGKASQASAKVIYDDQPSEIVSLEFLISEHDYDCGRQAESDLNQAAATATTIGKRRTCINVEMHRREIIHHWWDLIRSPKTHDALKLFLEQFSYLIIDDTLKRKGQVGNERARAFLVVFLGLTDYRYRSVLEHYERSAFDVFRHLSSFDEESPLNLQSSRENHRMAQQSGVKSLCRNLQKTFDSELNVDDIADKMIQSEHLSMEQAKDYINMNLSKDKINFLLTHIEASIPSTLAVFLQILETDYRQLYYKIKEASDKEGHVWRAVLEANRKNIVDKIHPKIRTILFALSKQDIITKEEHDRITSHHLCQEMSSCFIDVLIGKQFPVPSNVFEILKTEGFGELAKKLYKDQREYKEGEKGRVNSNWQNILETERQEIASNLTNTEKICELLQKSGILKKEQRKFIQDVSSAEQQGHYLIDEIKLMAYDGRKAFLEALQRTGNEHVYNHLARQEKLFENMPKQISSSAPDESGTKWIKLLDDTTIWISETMKEPPKVLTFLYRKGIVTINQRKEIEKYPEKQQVFDIIDEVKKMALRGRKEFLSALEVTGNHEIYALLIKLEKLKNKEYSQEVSVMTNKAEETTSQDETSSYNPLCILGRLLSGSSQATGGTLVSEDDGSSTDPPPGANAMDWEKSTDLEEALKRSNESYEKDEHKHQRKNEQSRRTEIEKTSESMNIIHSETRYEQPKCMPRVETSPSTTNSFNHNLLVDVLKRETKQKISPPVDVEVKEKSECNRNIANIEYPKEVPDHLVPEKLVRGSKIKMHLKGSTEYGSIKWIGYLKEGKSLTVGLEMENNVGYSDGMMQEKRLFKTSKDRGIFTKYEQCELDDRYPSDMQDTQIEYEQKPPREVIELDQPAKFRKEYAGRERGIVGRDNSCYLDSTLFCMFAFNDTFDCLFDIEESLTDNQRDIVDHVKANIINPLRSKFKVESESMMRLRAMLDNLNIVKGLRGDQKDPEEVLKALFQKAMNVKELYHMTNGTGDYFVQIFGSRDKNLIPTTQKLLNSTFLLNELKLSQAPESLIIQLPRYGKENKIYDKIFPTPVLHMDEIVQNALRFCIFCGNNAEIECKDCAGIFSFEDCVVPAYCNRCSEIRHSSPQRVNHKLITLPDDAKPVEQFELFGVLCIETSHYVAFAKTGKEENAPWVFFDSMADRVEELSGYAYNIPEVKVCKHLQNFLYEDGLSEIHTLKLSGEDHRFFSHSSVCFYRKIKP